VIPSMIMCRSDLSAAMQEYWSPSSSHVSSRGVGVVAYYWVPFFMSDGG